MSKKKLIVFIFIVLIFMFGSYVYNIIEKAEEGANAIASITNSQNLGEIKLDGTFNLVKVNITVQSGEMIKDSYGYHHGSDIEDSIERGYFKKVDNTTSEIKLEVTDSNGELIESSPIKNGEKTDKYLWLGKGEYYTNITSDDFEGVYVYSTTIYKIF